MPVVVFDLDDTLYDELTYLHGGLKFVSEYLATITKLKDSSIFVELKELAKTSRDKVFDRFLQQHDHFTKTLVRKCVSLYRAHKPQIELYPEAKKCLEMLSKRYPLYIVTDGNKLVQKRKLEALHIKKWVKKALCTHDFGKHSAKPSTYCFTKIAALEKVQPSQVIYIADNPKKDFVELKKKGFRTVRVRTGQYKDLHIDKAHEADHEIASLSSLPQHLRP